MSKATRTEDTTANEIAEKGKRLPDVTADGNALQDGAERIVLLSKDLENGDCGVKAFLDQVWQIVQRLRFDSGDPSCVLDLTTSLQPSPDGVASPFALFGTINPGVGNHVRCYLMGPGGRYPSDGSYLKEADYSGTNWALTPCFPLAGGM